MGLGQTGTTGIQEGRRCGCVRSQLCPMSAAREKSVHDSFDHGRAQGEAGEVERGDHAPVIVFCNLDSVSNKAEEGTIRKRI